jgi:hypothetical protein
MLIPYPNPLYRELPINQLTIVGGQKKTPATLSPDTCSTLIPGARGRENLRGRIQNYRAAAEHLNVDRA